MNNTNATGDREHQDKQIHTTLPSFHGSGALNSIHDPMDTDTFTNELVRQGVLLQEVCWNRTRQLTSISLLAEYTVLLLILVAVEGQQELLEIDGEYRE